MNCPARKLAAAVLAWTVAVAGAGRAAAETTGPAARAPAAGAAGDEWLGQIMLEELRGTVRTREYEDLVEWTVAGLFGRLACGDLEHFGSAADIIYVLRACRYFPLADGLDDGEKLVAWLAKHHDVSRLLFRAMDDGVDPEQSLKNFQTLLGASEKAVAEYPDLAVAFATSAPLRHNPPQPNPCSMPEAFRWYTDGGRRFRHDLKTMPYEALRFLANTRLSLAERQWAMKAYARHAAPAGEFSRIRYDPARPWRSKDQPAPGPAYTLVNLRRDGGACIDQAYYAAEICKALGIPAARVIGAGTAGGGAAWVAQLRVASRGDKAAWDAAAGRHKEHLNLAGHVQDPAGRLAPDAMLAPAAAAVGLTARRRDHAAAVAALARIVFDRQASAPADTMEALRQLAGLHNQRHADAPRVGAEGFRAVNEVGMKTVSDLIEQALGHNPACRQAWDLAAELNEGKHLPAGGLDRLIEILLTRTAREFPGLALAVLVRIADTTADEPQREKLYQRGMKAFAARPYIQGRLAIALGDEYRRQGRKKDALRTYEAAAMKHIALAEVAVDAAVRAEEMLVEAGRTDLAARLHGNLFARAARPPDRSPFRRQSAYCLIGARLADLMTKLGQGSAAKGILRKIGG